MSVGATYGKYFLLKKLAAGGMGEVFLARQQGPAGFEKILVVKRILNHLTENMDYVELFLQEARLQARMNHSSIVQIFDLGQAEEDGSFYLAMEFVHGKSLSEVVQRATKLKERIDPNNVATILEKAADGLAYAHNLQDNSGRSMNIIHRDISPQNILISYQGEVKLIDFGIAKSEHSVVKTETGTIKGKFYYMSPEQSAAHKLDKRSDIFALGIVLYECLTGENPFVRPNVVLSLEAIQRTDPPPVSSVDPALAPFDAIVSRALAKDREQRYQDASDLKDDLARVRASGVLPPPVERLNAFMARVFKEKLEQESKVLVDTDGASIGQMPSQPSVRVKPPTPAPVKVPTNGGSRPPRQQTPAPVKLKSGKFRQPTDEELSGDPTLPKNFQAFDASKTPPTGRAVQKAPPPRRPLPRQLDDDEDEGGTQTGEPDFDGDQHEEPEQQQAPRQRKPLPTRKRQEPEQHEEEAPGGGGAMVAGVGLLALLAAAGAAWVLVGPTKLSALTGIPLPGAEPAKIAKADPKALDDAPLKKVSPSDEAKHAEIEKRKAAEEEAARKIADARAAADAKQAAADAKIADARAAADEKKAEADRKADEAKAAGDAKKAEAAQKAEEAKAAAALKVEEAKAAGDAKRAEAARKAEEAKAAGEVKKAEAKAAAEVKKAEAAKKAEEAKAAGDARRAAEAKKAEDAKKAEEARRKNAKKLVMKTTPPATFTYNGTAIEGIKVDLVAANGTIEVLGELPFKVKITQSGDKIGISSEPWALVRVNGQPKGKTPIADLGVGEEFLAVELKSPQVDKPMVITMRMMK